MTTQEQKSYQAGRDFSKALLKERGLNIAFIRGVEDEIQDRWFECRHCDKLGIQSDPRQEYCDGKCKQAYYRGLKKYTDKHVALRANAPIKEGQMVVHDGNGVKPCNGGE